MEITRRLLIASMAAVAGATASRAAPLGALAAEPSLLDVLTAEIQWAQAALLTALEAGDYRAWEADFETERPHRMRLARALVLSRELDLSDPLAATVNRELETLWGALTRPPPVAPLIRRKPSGGLSQFHAPA